MLLRHFQQKPGRVRADLCWGGQVGESSGQLKRCRSGQQKFSHSEIIPRFLTGNYCPSPAGRERERGPTPPHGAAVNAVVTVTPRAQFSSCCVKSQRGAETTLWGLSALPMSRRCGRVLGLRLLLGSRGRTLARAWRGWRGACYPGTLSALRS